MNERHQLQSRLAVLEARDRAGGTWAALADAINRITDKPIKRQTAHWWSQHGRLPAERAIEIERATGVHRALLRPDLWEISQ